MLNIEYLVTATVSIKSSSSGKVVKIVTANRVRANTEREALQVTRENLIKNGVLATFEITARAILNDTDRVS